MRRREPQTFGWSATSEQIRVSLELFTPAELEARARREARKAQQRAKEAAKGPSLFEDTEQP